MPTRILGWLFLVSLVGLNALRADDQEDFKLANDQGKAALDKGDTAAAATHFEQAVEIGARAFGGDADETLGAMQSLGMSHSRGKQYAKAAEIYQLRLDKIEAKHGPDHALIALGLNDLANTLHLSAKYPEAVQKYERAMKIFTARGGTETAAIASLRHNLANSYRAQGKNAEAVPLLQQSLKF